MHLPKYKGLFVLHLKKEFTSINHQVTRRTSDASEISKDINISASKLNQVERKIGLKMK